MDYTIECKIEAETIAGTEIEIVGSWINRVDFGNYCNDEHLVCNKRDVVPEMTRVNRACMSGNAGVTRLKHACNSA